MNNNLPAELKEKISIFCAEIVGQLTETHAGPYDDLAILQQELYHRYVETTAEYLAQQTGKHSAALADEMDAPDKIEADTVIVEIVDNTTGKQFRRTLPIEYTETDNGIRLSGEALDGTTTQIVFFSDTAMNKINDLLGNGPTTPRCNHEE